MNRGSCNPPGSMSWASICFNEAPIHESGKYCHIAEAAALLVASMRPRFMNRGSACGRLGQGEEQEASMRPRFMNRGSPS